MAALSGYYLDSCPQLRNVGSSSESTNSRLHANLSVHGHRAMTHAKCMEVRPADSCRENQPLVSPAKNNSLT